MSTKVGVWIDHRKAAIVAVTDKGEEIGSLSQSPSLPPAPADGIDLG